MTAPTFVSEYESSSWDLTTTPQATFAAVEALAGEVVVSLLADDDDAGNENFTWTNTLTPQTWTEDPETAGGTNADCLCQTAHTIIPGGSAISSGVISVARTVGGSGRYGHVNLVFSGSDGIGATDRRATTGLAAASASFTTLFANSAICVIWSDWSAGDNTGRIWKTINGFIPTAGNGQEVVAFRNSAQYTVYAAYYPDAGAAGAKTIGLDKPAGTTLTGDFMWAAVEVRGTTGAPPVSQPLLLESGGYLLTQSSVPLMTDV